jgi:hypothetical protein
MSKYLATDTWAPTDGGETGVASTAMLLFAL